MWDVTKGSAKGWKHIDERGYTIGEIKAESD